VDQIINLLNSSGLVNPISAEEESEESNIMGGICMTNFKNMSWTTEQVKRLCNGLPHMEMITIVGYDESAIDIEELKGCWNLNI